MSFQEIKNIAIVGGSGQVGSAIVSNLLQNKQFSITAITRPSSKSKFPDGVKVTKGEYDDKKFLEESLKGQDALIIALGLEAPPQIQKDLIDVGAKVEIPYIMTNYWSSDGFNENLVEKMPLLQEKNKFHEQIEKLGKSNWLAISNNQWIDFNLREGYFGIDIPKRVAILFDGGNTKINTTTVAQVGRAVAALMSLPASKLSQYKNSFAYVRSFHVSQREMLEAIQRATNTTDKDWTIEEKSVEKHIAEGWKAKEEEDTEGKMKLVFGPTFKEGLGDKFYGKKLSNEMFDLPQEDLDEVVKEVVEQKRKEEEEDDD